MTLTLAEYASYDATDLSELVRSGDVAPLELLPAAEVVIATSNDNINAVVTPMFDEARAFLNLCAMRALI